MKDRIFLPNFYAILLAFCLVLLSCNREEEKLALVFKKAGTNKQELQKVLQHYTQDPADSLKLKAAYFLIENMPYHFSYDTTYLYKYRIVVDKIHSLQAKKLPAKVIREKVNPLMDSLIALYPLSNLSVESQQDAASVQSEYLISTIDQAFDVYHSMPFKDDILFEDFLDYILPYRVENGSCIEDWRTYFINRHPVNAAYPFTSIHQLSDSLLFRYSDVKIGWQIAEKFPYIKLNDYLRSMTTHCPQKCWFNCLLLRSHGIPATIDMVPASRIHPLGHEWNAIKLKNGTYPFEPFWQDSLRDLAPFYKRKKVHPDLGPFEFPKIYRKTFKINRSDLLTHALSSGEEIPPLFRDPFLKDVTPEYFKTFKLKTQIVNTLKDHDYIYACVLGNNRTWIPVDFAKINGNGALFNSLGSENVYLPAYYKADSVMAAAYPVLLQKGGLISTLRPHRSQKQKVKIAHLAYQRPELNVSKEAFIGATIEGSNHPNFNKSEILYRFNEPYEPGNHRVSFDLKRKYRYLRLTIPKSKTVLNEINFFTIKNGKEIEARGKLISSNPVDYRPIFQRLVDNDLTTGTTFTSLSNDKRAADKIWVGFDFERPITISAFEFYFIFYSNLRNGQRYELFYWDFGWKSLGQKSAFSTEPITFDKVPVNALLIMRIVDKNSYSRVFTYSGDRQHWY